MLPDFKLSSEEDEYYPVDEISCDTCRFWDKKTRQSMDKMFRFNKGDISKLTRKFSTCPKY
jgi:phosphoribosylaminoimidazole-succinocarboxamide synthase